MRVVQRNAAMLSRKAHASLARKHALPASVNLCPSADSSCNRGSRQSDHQAGHAQHSNLSWPRIVSEPNDPRDHTAKSSGDTVLRFLCHDKELYCAKHRHTDCSDNRSSYRLQISRHRLCRTIIKEILPDHLHYNINPKLVDQIVENQDSRL